MMYATDNTKAVFIFILHIFLLLGGQLKAGRFLIEQMGTAAERDRHDSVPRKPSRLHILMRPLRVDTVPFLIRHGKET